MLGHPRRDRDDAADVGGARPRHHGVELVGEIGKIEVAVTIDQHGASFRLVEARKDPRRRRQLRAGRDAPAAAKPREVARVRRHRHQVKQLGG